MSISRCEERRNPRMDIGRLDNGSADFVQPRAQLLLQSPVVEKPLLLGGIAGEQYGCEQYNPQQLAQCDAKSSSDRSSHSGKPPARLQISILVSQAQLGHGVNSGHRTIACEACSIGVQGRGLLLPGTPSVGRLDTLRYCHCNHTLLPRRSFASRRGGPSTRWRCDDRSAGPRGGRSGQR